MWRSQARRLLIGRSTPTISPPNHTQVLLLYSSSLIPYPFPNLSTWFSQNPRFFSNDTQPDDQEVVFDENPRFISQESQPSSLIFDEEHDDASQEGIESRDNPESSFVSQELEEVAVEEEALEIDNEQLENVLSVLQSSVDGSLSSSLDNLGLNLNEEFVIRVIQTPLVPGEHLIGFFKWVSKNQDFLVTSQIVDSLARAVGAGLRKKDAYALWDLVKEVGEKDKALLNTDILNELISLFWNLGKGKAALEVFNKFEELGCEPNSDSYYLTILALCRRKLFDWAWSVCDKMLNAGKLPDGEKIAGIITCFCKGSKAKDAHLVYLMANEKNIRPPHFSINFLIHSLCKEDETVKLAVELLETFSGDERKYAVKPFSTVVRGLCRVKDVEGAKKLLFNMIDAGPPPGNAVFNSVVTGLSKAGEMEEAISIMKVMENRGLRPDVYTYSVIMSGYAKMGQMEEAERVFSEAKEKHCKLTPVTYHILIRGYCKLEKFDEALKLLKSMEKSNVKPNADEYNKMVQSLCLKALDWGKAETLLEEMKKKGMHLNGITRGLIKAVKELEEEELETDKVSIEA